MASRTQRGTEAARSPTACYRELSQFPAVTGAALGAAAGEQSFQLYTECSRPDLPRRRLLRFSRHYSLHRTGNGGLTVSRAALSAEINNQLLSRDSPTGQHRAVLSRCPRQGHELLEVWGSSGRSHSVDLTALGKHGEVYTEGPFACLAWSHSETRLLYVAEKSRPKRWAPGAWDVPGAARPAEEAEHEEDTEQFVYHEDWGEALSTRSMPVLCALDLESCSLSVLEGIPEHLSPGQALWSPGDRGVVFVGWWHEPFRLGLSACSNRRSGIFHLDLSSRSCGEHRGRGGGPCVPEVLTPASHRAAVSRARSCLLPTAEPRRPAPALPGGWCGGAASAVPVPAHAHLADAADSDGARCSAGAHRGLRRAVHRGAATEVLGSRQPASRAGHPTAQPHGPAAGGHGGSHRHQPDGRVAPRVLGAAHPPVGPAGSHMLSTTPPPEPGSGGAATSGPGAAASLGADGGHPDSARCHLEDPDGPAPLQWAEPSCARHSGFRGPAAEPTGEHGTAPPRCVSPRWPPCCLRCPLAPRHGRAVLAGLCRAPGELPWLSGLRPSQRQLPAVPSG